MVGNVILLVINSPAFVLASLADWAYWPGAVFALVDSLTVVRFGVVGNILLA